MIIPTHLNFLSIIPLAVGVLILFYNKTAGVGWADFMGKRFAEYYGSTSPFTKSQERMRAWGFYRFQVIFFGIMMVLMAWVISFGPIYTGEAAEQIRQEGLLRVN